MRHLAILLLLCGGVFADRLVDRDGRVLKGDITIDAKYARVGSKKLALGDVFLAEKDDGTLVYARDFDTRMRGYEWLARHHLKKAYLKLLRKALSVKDYALAHEVLELAEGAGLAGKEVGKHKRRIEKVSGSGKPSARVRTEFNAIRNYYGELLLLRAERSLKTTDGKRLLREALRLSPRSEKGRALLGSIAPRAFPIGNARVWLDWQVDLVGSGATIATGKEEARYTQLATARSQWRSDLHGVYAEPILMIMPVKDSRVIGRALAYGRLVTTALAELFKTDKPARTPTQPMTVFLFESRDEYMNNTGTGKPQANPASLEWTAGHYSPSEGISRFFWFADVDAERRIAGTCMHELTHHWLEERNPRISARAHQAGLPAYWIVEGFATFMEEGIFDIDTGKWTLFNPRCRSLDILQAIPRGKLVRWDRYYAMSQVGFMRMPRNNQVEVQGRWFLHPSVMSTTRIFYEQAGATCQFLYHADGGKYRQKLLDFVVAYYTGNARKLDIQTAFGMSDAALGDRVVGFAQEVARGWRPKPK